MSKLSDATYDFLEKTFPYNIISREYYIKYNNTRLFFDFYIKDLGLVIEVQGHQHDEFVKHFHTFLLSKKRDNLKKEYCEKTGLVLLEIRSEEELDRDKFIERVRKGVIA